jgi:hypothetical protein
LSEGIFSVKLLFLFLFVNFSSVKKIFQLAEMTQHGHSERRDYMALNFKQHNHSKATTSSHNNRRSEPDPQQPHW